MKIASRVIADPGSIPPRVAHLALVKHPTDGAILDEALITRFEGPHSYTGEDVVEISIHGGAIVPALVLSAVIAAGARQALPGEFTRRALANGRIDLLQAEAVSDLIDARSRLAHRVAINQLDGGLSQRVLDLRDAVLELEALIAYDIDFPEEDEGAVDRQRVTAALTRAIRALEELLGTRDSGEIVREGALVVIGGAPNAGKSSLFNALLGRERSIVTPIAGTTRDAIEAVIDVGGWPVRLVDTAGLRESSDVVERIGIEITERYLTSADIVILCAEEPEELEALIQRARVLTSAPIVPVQTKVDLHPGLTQAAATSTLYVSAITGQGLDTLVSRLSSVLSERFGAVVGEAPLLTRERHRDAIAAARAELLAFQKAWVANTLPSSVAAIHLRQASHSLGELIGVVHVDEVLDRVFSSFCVGK